MAVPPISKPQGQERQARAEVQPRQLRGCTEMKDDDDDIQDYVRPWVGLTHEEFLKACQLAESGNYMVAFQRIQEWLKEKNT